MSANKESLSEALLQSIDLIAQSQADSTPATLTIEAQVVEALDEGKGIYKVKYLGNTFEATSAHADNIYNIDDMVYVVVPNGNFDNNKIILSPVSPVTAEYASTQADKLYITLGDNLFFNIQNVKLSTYHSESKEVDWDAESDAFPRLFNSALKDSRFFSFSCRIQTKIEKDRRVRGNYGLKLTLPVVQDGLQKPYEVILDINNLKGDPYNFSEFAFQQIYFELPEDMTYDNSQNTKIEAFINDFEQDESKKDNYDIFIKDISLVSTYVVKSEDIPGYYMTLSASEGTAFLPGPLQDSKVLSPILYLNSRPTNINTFDCYWFKENYLIDSNSDKYNRLGGLGWEILNSKTHTVINDSGEEEFQYVTNVYTHKIYKEEVHHVTRYKCVLVKNDKVVSQIISIRNLANAVDIQFLSASGSNQYVKNSGMVRLLIRYCEEGITSIDNPNTLINYAFQRYDKFGNYIDNNFYTVDKLNEKVLIGGKQYYETEISYNTSKIDDFNTIYCSIYRESSKEEGIIQSIIGTNSLLISVGEAPNYNIRVENGDKLFKYDADGDSPLVASYDGPLSSAIKNIDPISITLFKPDGSEFTEDEYAITTVEWWISMDSMITLSSAQKEIAIQKDGYYIISGNYNGGFKTLSYGIASSYNKSHDNNTIIIKAFFKDNEAQNVANLKFLKDGESGTNGSKYAAVITYNDLSYEESDPKGKVSKLQLLYAADESAWYYYDAVTMKEPISIEGANPALDIRLYSDGEQIPVPAINDKRLIEWNVFDKDYKYDDIVSPIVINTNKDNQTGIISITDDEETKFWDGVKNYCATIEAKVTATKDTSDESVTDSQEYVYAYYPIEMTYVAKKEYFSSIVPNIEGGFSQVLYASDGTNPMYNNNKVFNVVNNPDIVSLPEFYEFDWATSPNLKIKARTEEEPTEYCSITPSTKFDSGTSKNFVRASFKLKDNAQQTLINKINELNNNITKLNNNKNYYENLQTSFFNEFNYNDYKERLTNVSNFFKIKVSLVGQHNDYLTILTNIKNNFNTYFRVIDKEKQETIIDEKIKTFKTLLKNSLALGVDIDAKDNILNIHPGTLLLDFKNDININTDDIYYVTINDQIKHYNDKISTIYLHYYIELSNDTLCESVCAITADLNAFVNNDSWIALVGEGEQQYQYSGLKEAIKGKYDSLSTTNYTFNGVLDTLWSIELNLIPYRSISYADKIAELENQIESYVDELDKYNKLTLEEGILISHIKPVIMIFNRYEMSNINGWDGNKLTLGNDEGYILSPQIGAGRKEEGRFTGIVMGVKQTQVREKDKTSVGLFGYHKGKQSIFLNAKDGSATFGVSGGGQIIIKPAEEGNKQTAVIKSSNYDTSTNEGMMIDFATPEIKFKSGKFKVNSKGEITAKGGGSIAGWNIGVTDHQEDILFSKDKHITLNATKSEIYFKDGSSGKIYSGKHSSLNDISNGFYLSNDGLSIGSKVNINSDGVMTLGSGSKKWIIDSIGDKPDNEESYIAYNKDGSQRVYIGTDKISLGPKIDGVGKFEVNSNGEGKFAGSIEATSGTIGGWTIGSNSLSSNNRRVTLSNNGDLACVDGNGKPRWTIGENGEAIFWNIKANGGSVGNWTIGDGLSAAVAGYTMKISPIDGISGTAPITKTAPQGCSWSLNSIGMQWKKGSDVKFSISQEGVLTAKDANFSGTVTASKFVGQCGFNNGSIVGTGFKIDGTGITFNSNKLGLSTTTGSIGCGSINCSESRGTGLIQAKTVTASDYFSCNSLSGKTANVSIGGKTLHFTGGLLTSVS